MSGFAEMPRYRCHKVVHALKIRAITSAGLTTPGVTIHPEEQGFAPFIVDQQFVVKHAPKVGGYYVVYEDGYKSWSPAEAFEAGYTRI